MMKFKKSFAFVLIFMGIIAFTASAVSASSFGSGDNEVIIDGVTFELNQVSNMDIYDTNVVSFKVGSNIYGLIDEIDTDNTLEFNTQNDSSRGYFTEKCNTSFIKGDLYIFGNEAEQNEGYIIIFQKDNKKFVYKIFSDMPSSNETISAMCESMYQFVFDNNLSTIESLDGKSVTILKPSNSMSILKSTIVTGSHKNDKTKCTVYVGEQYAGENVQISVLYSRDGEYLNEGLLVDKKVSDSGKITVKSKYPLAKYPNNAKITIYDSNGNPLDTQTVTLSKNSKLQSFNF